jgi:hypothetical protein
MTNNCSERNYLRNDRFNCVENCATAINLLIWAEMKKRFEEYLDHLTKGKEPGKVRIVWSDPWT